MASTKGLLAPRPSQRERRQAAVLAALPDGSLRAAVVDYVHNLLCGAATRKINGRTIDRIDHVDVVNDLACAYLGVRPRKTGFIPRMRLSGENLERGLRNYLRAEGKKPRAPRAARQPVAANLSLLGDVAELDATQRAVLQFVIGLRHSGELKELAETFTNLDLSRAAELVATATALDAGRVAAALRPSSRLIAAGLVAIESGSADLYDKLGLKDGLLDAVFEPALDRAGLLARFLPEAKPSPLEWDDFAHVGDAARMARDLVGAALRTRRSGVNVLFYGDTGVGKTVLATLLARDLGAKLYAAGRADDEGAPPSARERLSSLLLGQRLVADASAVLLFDELEDLFAWQWRGFGGDRALGVAEMSKQWFNELLESNPVPTIWISNRVEGIDLAFLRRFTYAIELRPLGARQRARVLARHLGSKSAVAPAEIDRIAERFVVSPAQIGTAVAAARLVAPDGRPDRTTIERLLGPIDKLLTGADSSRRPVFDGATYCLDALNSPADLTGIADRLADWKLGRAPGVSLCLYGPPGTGKSEYVKYLAHRMGRPIVHRRVSDLLSMWVGGTERALAAAFREAEDDDAVLLFDEADTFLRDRRQAAHSWEVSQVNEFLQQLESFRGVVACTTNLWRDLDEASLRRFVFKIELRYIRPDQAAALFRSVLGPLLDRPLTEADEAAVASSLAAAGNLTPGDFAAVARGYAALGDRRSPLHLVAAVAAECRARPTATRPAGFRT